MPQNHEHGSIIIGIDQSYQNTGICVLYNKKVLKLTSIQLSKLSNNYHRRTKLKHVLNVLIESIKIKYPKIPIICYIERIRLRSQGFININYIKSIGALNACIIDSMFYYDISVYSVDTRSWKSTVIGTSKPSIIPNKYGVPNEKWPTIQWCIQQGYECYIRIPVLSNRKTKNTFTVKSGNKYYYDTDIADALGIAYYYYKNTDSTKLQEEY